MATLRLFETRSKHCRKYLLNRPPIDRSRRHFYFRLADATPEKKKVWESDITTTKLSLPSWRHYSQGVFSRLSSSCPVKIEKGFNEFGDRWLSIPIGFPISHNTANSNFIIVQISLISYCKIL